jgi:hypothetical protein
MISAPCTNHLHVIRGGLVRGIATGDPSTRYNSRRVDRTQCSMQTARGLTVVSHACDPRTHREPGILNRAYAKTVKLKPVKPTQERSLEKPRAPPADSIVLCSFP